MDKEFDQNNKTRKKSNILDLPPLRALLFGVGKITHALVVRMAKIHLIIILYIKMYI